MLTTPSISFAVSQAGGIVDAFDATARGAALGSRFALCDGGPFAVHLNPAALALPQRPSVGYTYHELAAGLADDVKVWHVGGTFESEGIGVGASFSRLGQGEQQMTDVDGNSTGTFEPYQTSIQLGVGILLTSFLDTQSEEMVLDLALGANVKRIHDRLAPSGILQGGGGNEGSAFTADAGAILRAGLPLAWGGPDPDGESYLGVRAAVVFDDVPGAELKFDGLDQTDPLQRYLRWGVALEGQLFPTEPIGHLVEFTLMYEVADSKVEGDETHVETRALELIVGGAAAFRIGQYRDEEGDIFGPTVGVGVGLDWTGLPGGLWLDYASRPQATEFENVHVLSVTALASIF
jgi:hypothetical protein